MVADKFLCRFLIPQRKWIFQPAKIKYNYCRNRNASGSFNKKHSVHSCLVIAPVIIFSKINYNNITFLKTDSPLNMHSVETSGNADGNVWAECWKETSRDRISGSGKVMQDQADKERSPRHLIGISDKPHTAPGRLPGLKQASCVSCLHGTLIRVSVWAHSQPRPRCRFPKDWLVGNGLAGTTQKPQLCPILPSYLSESRHGCSYCNIKVDKRTQGHFMLRIGNDVCHRHCMPLTNATSHPRLERQEKGLIAS